MGVLSMGDSKVWVNVSLDPMRVVGRVHERPLPAFGVVANEHLLPASELFFTRGEYADSQARGQTVEIAWHIIRPRRAVGLDVHRDRLGGN
jgi:hypothetical protein